MAFRFIIISGDKRQELGWYEESGPMTAPMAMAHVREAFPDGAISIERENRADAKDAAKIGEDLKAVKEK